MSHRSSPALPPHTPVIVAGLRTPVGTAGHALAHVEASTLAATVLTRLVDELAELGVGGETGARVDHVVLGNCMGPGGNVARVATLEAGLGPEVPAVTVDRQCGSGQEAIHHGAALVALGQADLVLAGGVESASTAPWRVRRPEGGVGLSQRGLSQTGVSQTGDGRTGSRPSARPTGLPAGAEPYARAPFAPPGWPDPDMGPAAQDVADRFGIDRERQDRYAARSHERTLLCAELIADELVPVGGLTRDERPRRLSAQVLARLPGAFTVGGSVTAGNSCGISDGAAGVAIVPERIRAELGLSGIALRGWQATGSDPALPGIGPLPAIRALLARAEVSLEQIAVLEITEAFAAQVLACTDALGLDPLGADADRVCAWGGAIALGHPWGASGALLAVRAFARLVRRPDPAMRSGWGLVTCAIGGGQGLAMLVERVGP